VGATPYDFDRFLRYDDMAAWLRQTAAPPVTSVAWMLASIQCAGFVSWPPVAESVIVARSSSRPRCDVPYASSVRRLGSPRHPPPAQSEPGHSPSLIEISGSSVNTAWTND
jgi:hypothetical protein